MENKELRVEMLRHGDTMETLAEYLGIAKSTLIRKVAGEVDFKQSEMNKIKIRYGLSDERFAQIFCTKEVIV